MRSSLSILATVLFLAGQARAFNAYVGCLDINSAALDSTIILNSAAVQSPAACADACAARPNGHGYSAFRAAGPSCADITSPADWTIATDSAGTCAAGDYSLYRLNSEWQSDSVACNSEYAATRPRTSVEIVPSLGECFRLCVTYPAMVVVPSPRTGGFSCQCAQAILDPVAATCQQDTGFAYRRSAAAAASGVYRRSLKDTASRKLAARQNHKYCPASLQPCRISGSNPDAYECMDTQYELESCGGCAMGEFGSSGNSTATAAGIDCTRLTGVPMGAVSCLEGKCVAYACKKGFTLQSGGCVKA
ncbi:uncharacterized protein MKK02DRAFT_41092 [Dioszegia hungarica]|uniref:Protein CPL1-like domain-containing protein n=1 Tax=Dioszegia hungarica TaxID=4972 RepID=A0AA38H339_9TREE|nr:uncharacterized protein MKK02DRAFT_41092 [Dioszegia hungarica]KAI9632781.1 hypothetical protein MKK02DRAFT_41092 [Dioszegia hungarica]